jgi:hypothetical protein
MLRRADLTVRGYRAFADQAQNGIDSGGLGQIMEWLQAKIELGQIQADLVEVTLIGHSMGAIVVDQIVIRYPNLPLASVVHLASADTIRSVENSVVAHMRLQHIASKSRQTRFYSVMLHPDREDQEKYLANSIPKGSLLTWIDSFYSRPPSSADRRFGRWANVKTWVETFPSELQRVAHFTVCRYDTIAGPTKHGDFFAIGPDRSPYWDVTFWQGQCASD